MKKIMKIGGFFISICLLMMLIPRYAYAASASVSVSKVSGNVGSTVSVSCTATVSGASIGGADVTLVYDASALTLVSCSTGANGGSGSVIFSQAASNSGQSSLSFTMTFKILKEGTSTISVANAEVFDWDYNDITPGKSAGSVTGKAVTTSNNNGSTGSGGTGTGGTGTGGTGTGGTGTGSTGTGNTTAADTKDSNSKLSSLQVSPGTLAPAFDAGTTSYTVTVSKDTKEVTIAAAAQSSKASVSTSGGKDLVLGENTAKVVVTAENGSTTVYNLTIVCGEEETIQIDGTNYHINESFTDEQIPTGFVRDKVTYNEREYVALKLEAGDLSLMALENENTEFALYIYDQETQEFYTFLQIFFSGERFIIPLPLDNTKEFADKNTTTVTLSELTFDAWEIDEDYCILRVINSEGEITYYQYDRVDDTIQRYAGEIEQPEIVEAEETKSQFAELLKKYDLYIIAGLTALAVILLIVIICVIATRPYNHQVRRRKIQKKLEKQKDESQT